MVFERCVSNSSLQTPCGAAAARRRGTAEVQPENVFASSAVKLCLRRLLHLTPLLTHLLFSCLSYHFPSLVIDLLTLCMLSVAVALYSCGGIDGVRSLSQEYIYGSFRRKRRGECKCIVRDQVEEAKGREFPGSSWASCSHVSLCHQAV